ncbi:hypothetical protein ASD74_15090 [Rhizobium sp. Root564]|nr:hypothetical protein ASD74_15090 [Rhizobium sp. Root564]
MSALNIIQQAEAVHLITDGASYELDGTIIDILPSKVFILSEAKAAIAFRGRTIEWIPHELLNCDSLEAALELIPAIARASIEYLHNLEYGQNAESLRHFECVVAGWSEKNDRPEAWGMTTRIEEQPDIFRHVLDFTPFTMFELPVLVASPAVSLSEVLGTVATLEDVDALAPQDAGLSLLQAQRKSRYPVEGEPQYIVGGYGEITTIDRCGVRQSRLVTWPDQIGRLIDPFASATNPDRGLGSDK